MSPENPSEYQIVPALSATIKCGIGPPAMLITCSLIVIVPVVVGVKLPIFCVALSANQIVPVASFVIPYGKLPAVAIAVSTKALVVVLKKPILSAEYSVNQILPLLSRTKSYGLALAVGTFHCFQAGRPVLFADIGRESAGTIRFGVTSWICDPDMTTFIKSHSPWSGCRGRLDYSGGV